MEFCMAFFSKWCNKNIDYTIININVNIKQLKTKCNQTIS